MKARPQRLLDLRATQSQESHRDKNRRQVDNFALWIRKRTKRGRHAHGQRNGKPGKKELGFGSEGQKKRIDEKREGT